MHRRKTGIKCLKMSQCSLQGKGAWVLGITVLSEIVADCRVTRAPLQDKVLVLPASGVLAADGLHT